MFPLSSIIVHARLLLSFFGVFGRTLTVPIMVTSKLSSNDRRLILRTAFHHCIQGLGYEHHVDQLFFLADPAEAPEEVQSNLDVENRTYGDLVFVGGPDSDPWVPRDATYVLDRPTSRGYRLAYGTAWLAKHRQELDYVMYLDDDSYLHIPKLLNMLEMHTSQSLAMGFVMETVLDSTRSCVCDMCPSCERCLKDDQLNSFCAQFPEMSLGGCLTCIQQCDLFNDGEDLALCVQQKQLDIVKVAQYFGTQSAPRWFLGMGWVFGRRIVNFLAHNVDHLKKRGAADVQLGFWLAPLEDIHWVDMKDGFFHDYPMPGSTFSRGCTERSILVHRMNEDRWKHFDTRTCELHCPLTAAPE